MHFQLIPPTCPLKCRGAGTYHDDDAVSDLSTCLEGVLKCSLRRDAGATEVGATKGREYSPLCMFFTGDSRVRYGAVIYCGGQMRPRNLVAGIVGVLSLIVVVSMIPDIVRYIKIKSM